MRELISSIKNMPKHFVTAVQNIWRNGIMSFSSIFAVTITLLLIGIVGAIAMNLSQITSSIENSVSIYVQLDRTIEESKELEVGDEIRQVNGVKTALYSSKDEQLDKYIENYGGEDLLNSYREDNPLGAAYTVEVTNPKSIESIASKIGDIEGVNKVEFGGSATSDMLDTLELIRSGGSIFVVMLVIIALFMISNTIKITITSRRTEIAIMRMVGASNWYIRIPFMLEGLLIGIIGAIIPILVIVFGYTFIYNATGGMLVSAMFSILQPYPFVTYFSLVLVGLGSGVGLIGSFMAVRKFLKF